MTRVTHRTIQESTLANLQRNLTSMSSLQEKLSTGRNINRPSDDPTGTVNALQLRADLRTATQHTRSAEDGIGWLDQVDTALQETSRSLQAVKVLGLQGANGSQGPTSRKAIALEVQGIRDAVVGLANTTYLGRSVFAGTAAEGQALDPVTHAWADTGTGTVERRVAANSTVRVDSPGSAVFGEGATSVFALLDRIAAEVEAGSTALSGSLDELDDRLSTVLNELSSVGARYGRVQVAKQAADDKVLGLQTSLAGVESIDLPKTIVDLQMQEVAYKAALGATAKVLQPSLLDFLR